MNSNSAFSKILCSKRFEQKSESKSKESKGKNPWKNERNKNREQKRGWSE